MTLDDNNKSDIVIKKEQIGNDENIIKFFVCLFPRSRKTKI